MRYPSILVVASTLACVVSASASPQPINLYQFKGGQDGRNPNAGLVADAQGNLYGTTLYGGGAKACDGGCGTVFELSPPASAGNRWTETVLYRFQGSPDVANPIGGLAMDANGALYGTTMQGGNSSWSVFQLTPPSAPGGTWAESVLYSFTGADGDNNFVAFTPVIGPNGVLYGKYPGNTGELFVLTPPPAAGDAWSETTIHVGACIGDSGLVLASDGTLYGTTELCGRRGRGGSVFSLTPPASPGGKWTVTALSDISCPGAPAMSPDGSLYAAAARNGEMLFELTPPPVSGGSWTESTIHKFTGQPSDGFNPREGPVLGPAGVLYGVTRNGGTENRGTIYQAIPPAAPGGAWTESVLYSFTKRTTNGAYPYGILIGSNGTLYGTTYVGGRRGKGTVFGFVP